MEENLDVSWADTSDLQVRTRSGKCMSESQRSMGSHKAGGCGQGQSPACPQNVRLGASGYAHTPAEEQPEKIPLFSEASCALARISCIPRKYVLYTKSVIRVRPEVGLGEVRAREASEGPLMVSQ